MSTLTSLMDEKASRLADQVDDLGRDTADNLHAAASSIRKGSRAIDDIAESAANKLDGAGAYVEKHNLKRTMGESRKIIRQYPAKSLALAAGAGFLIGFAFHRLTQASDKSPA